MTPADVRLIASEVGSVLLLAMGLTLVCLLIIGWWTDWRPW